MRKYILWTILFLSCYLVFAIIFNMWSKENIYPSVKGKTYVNKVSGETFILRRTTLEDKGYLEFDFILTPNGFVGTEHIHLNQDEKFKVISGKLNMIVDGKNFVLNAGEEYTVKRGLAHRVWNEGKDTSRSVVSFTPGNNFEIFLITLCGLANDGKTDNKGQPSFMQIMMLVNKYEVYISGPPIFLQKTLSFMLAPIAYLRGNKNYYPHYL
jgi:uncharacterized cupin superfamily protein